MSFFSIIGFLFLLIGHGQTDLLDNVPTEAYWKAKQVTVTTELLLTELKAPAVKGDGSKVLTAEEKAQIEQAIKDLASEDFDVRVKARKLLTEAGSSIREQLTQAQFSEEPKIASYCKNLLGKMSTKVREREVRKLMVIRTLGERKATAAVPTLTELTSSKESFVADYASRALAQIAGKTWTPKRDTDTAENDVLLLPANTGVLAQLTSTEKFVIGTSRIQEMTPALYLEKMKVTKEQFGTEIGNLYLSMAEQVGNVRVDHVTLGVSDDIGQSGGWVTVIVDGQFDGKHADQIVDGLFSGISRGYGPKLVKRTEGDLMILENAPPAPPTTDGDGAMTRPMMHSREQICFITKGDHRLVFLVAGSDTSMAQVKESVLKALAADKGQGGIEDNEEIGKLIKQVDRTQELWVVATKVPSPLKRVPWFAGIDSGFGGAAVKDGVIDWQIQGTGSDPAAVAGSVDALNQDLQREMASAKEYLTRRPQEAEMINQVVAVWETIKGTAQDNQATVTGKITLDFLAFSEGIFYKETRMIGGPSSATRMEVQAATQSAR